MPVVCTPVPLDVLLTAAELTPLVWSSWPSALLPLPLLSFLTPTFSVLPLFPFVSFSASPVCCPAPIRFSDSVTESPKLCMADMWSFTPDFELLCEPALSSAWSAFDGLILLCSIALLESNAKWLSWDDRSGSLESSGILIGEIMVSSVPS